MAKPVRDTWEPLIVSDVAVDDGAKTLTVPTGKQYYVMSIYVKVVATATVGDRQIAVEVLDTSSNVTDQIRACVVLAAGETRYYAFQPSAENMAAFIDTDFATACLPASWILSAGESIKVWDNNEVDPDLGVGDTIADDVLVYMRVLERSV